MGKESVTLNEAVWCTMGADDSNVESLHFVILLFVIVG